MRYVLLFGWMLDDWAIEPNQWRIKEGGKSGHGPSSNSAIDFGPLQRRNKREILENLLNYPFSRTSESAT